MNNKNKVLKILDKHRDMSLTMGGEVRIGALEMTIIQKINGSEFVWSTNKGTILWSELEGQILGHPATPLVLLKALEEVVDEVYISGRGEVVYVNYGEEETLGTIPLTTTLTELPHTHKLWTDLLPILS